MHESQSEYKHQKTIEGTPELATRRDGRGYPNGVVEREPKGFVHVLTALAVVEEVLLEVVGNIEQNAARGVRHDVNTVIAGDAARDSSCIRKQGVSEVTE